MIEDFNLEYKDFFNEPDYTKRWQSLLKIYEDDYGSHRILSLIEAVAFLDKWQEPTVEELNKVLDHVRKGGRITIQIGEYSILPLQPDLLAHDSRPKAEVRRRWNHCEQRQKPPFGKAQSRHPSQPLTLLPQALRQEHRLDPKFTHRAQEGRPLLLPEVRRRRQSPTFSKKSSQERPLS